MPRTDMQAIYLHGFASGPASRKAHFYGRRLQEWGVPVQVPDLANGDFKGLTLSGQLAVIDSSLKGDSRPTVLIGSSLGGYLAALYAARHPEILGLVLLAPAFDFYRLWLAGMTVEQAARWKEDGIISVYHYGMGQQTALGYQLLEDARQFESFPAVRQPALILHGTEDQVVPITLSERFVRENRQTKLVTLSSGHELTDVLEPMWNETQKFLQELRIAVPMID